MKIKMWFFLQMVFLLLFNANAKAATISGYVSGNNEKQIRVFYPFNEFTTVQFLLQEKSLIDLDSSGKFTVQLDIAHPTFIKLYIDYNPVDLFVDNNSNLLVEIHLDSITKDSHKGWLNIKGEHAQGNLYFNEYNFDPHTEALKEVKT